MNYEDKKIPLRKHKHTLFGVAAVTFITTGKKILFSTNIVKNLVTSILFYFLGYMFIYFFVFIAVLNIDNMR